MSEPVKVNVVSYGGVKPGQVVVGNGTDGTKTTLFDAATATSGSYMFFGCSNLTSWTVDLPNLSDGSYMFHTCQNLASWNVDLPSLTNGTHMFQACINLTAWNGDIPNLSDGSYMFRNCEGLTSWTDALPSLTNGTQMFYGCSNMTSWNVALPSLTNGDGMFQSCTLDASSVLQILTSVPDRASAGLAAAKLHIGRNINYKDDADVAAMLGTVAPIAAGTYSCKGWNVTVQS